MRKILHPASRGGRPLLLATLCGLTSLRALEPNEWQNRQPLAVERAGVTKFALPPATLDLARPGLEDLRLLDPAGRETPFVLERAAPAAPASVRAPKSFRPALLDASTQLLVETGGLAPLDALILTTPATTFLKGARVEISADGREWETVQSGAPLFRQFGAEQLRLDLGRRAAAHVRVTIDDARTRPVPFTGATLVLAPSNPPPVTLPLPVRIARREEFAGETVLTLDLGASHVPLASFEFVTPEPLFARNVTVAIRELRDDAAVERTVAHGSLYRIGVDGLPPRAQLELPIDFTAPTREVLVHVVNGDSPLLALEEIRAQQRPVWLVFRAAEPGAYTLLTGNPDAPAPRYDLATLAPALREAAPAALTVGPAALNPGYRRVDALANTPLLGAALDPAPWSYRKPVRLATAGVQLLELDLDVLARATDGLSDLRLVRGGAQVPYLIERPALSRSTALTPTPAGDPKRPGLSRWELKLPRVGLPLTRLTLASSTALFRRHLRLFEKNPDGRGGIYERELAEADWSKTPGGETALLVLPLHVRPAVDALWLETDNGDNPPLVLTSVQAAYPVTRLLFKIEPAAPAGDNGNNLALYYGNRQAAAPRYDLALVATQILAAEKNVATLDAEQQTKSGGWAAGALAAARGGALFWGVLAFVVIVLLAIVAKLLPKPPAAG